MALKLIRVGSNKMKGISIICEISGVGFKEAKATLEKVEQGEVVDIVLKKGHNENEAVRLFNLEEGYYAVSTIEEESERRTVITCKNPNCKKKLSVPLVDKSIIVTCPQCKFEFKTNSSKPEFDETKFTDKDMNDIFGAVFNNGKDSGQTSSTQSKSKQATPPTQNKQAAWSFNKQASTSSSQNTEAPTTYNTGTPIRTYSIERYTHTHKDLTLKGVSNTVKDLVPVEVKVDGVSMGILSKEVITIPLDRNAHKLKVGSSGGSVPAGTESYNAFYFNGMLCAGPENDPFRTALTKTMIDTLRQGPIRKLISDRNNDTHRVDVYINSLHVRLFFPQQKPKGLKDWSLGGHEIIYEYSDLALPAPLPEELQPSGYWRYIEDWVQSEIGRERSLGLERRGSSFYLK